MIRKMYVKSKAKIVVSQKIKQYWFIKKKLCIPYIAKLGYSTQPKWFVNFLKNTSNKLMWKLAVAKKKFTFVEMKTLEQKYAHVYK